MKQPHPSRPQPTPKAQAQTNKTFLCNPPGLGAEDQRAHSPEASSLLLNPESSPEPHRLPSSAKNVKQPPTTSIMLISTSSFLSGPAL